MGRVVPSGQLGPRGLRHAAAAEGGDATAVAAGEDRGVGDQAGGLALSRRRGEKRHCGLGGERNTESRCRRDVGSASCLVGIKKRTDRMDKVFLFYRVRPISLPFLKIQLSRKMFL